MSSCHFSISIFGRTHPPMIGLDVQLAPAPSWSELEPNSLRRPGTPSASQASRSRRAGSRTARSRNSMRSLMRCGAWSPRAAPRDARRGHGHAADRPSITKRIVLPAGLREAEMEIQVESENHQYIPFSLDEVQPRLPCHRPQPKLDRRRRRAHRCLPQGSRAGSPGPGRSRRPEALRRARHRVARLRASRWVRSSQPARAGQGHAGRAVRDRRRHRRAEGAARRRDALRPRPDLRWRPAHPAHLAPVRLLVRGSRAEEAGKATCRRTSSPRC